MPVQVVRRIGSALNAQQKPLNGSTILVLGVAYKRDIADVRESPALTIIKLLEDAGALVQYHDPLVPSFSFQGKTYSASRWSPSLLRKADCVVIVTNHSTYAFDDIARQSRLVVDTRNAIRSRKYRHVVRL